MKVMKRNASLYTLGLLIKYGGENPNDTCQMVQARLVDTHSNTNQGKFTTNWTVSERLSPSVTDF